MTIYGTARAAACSGASSADIQRAFVALCEILRRCYPSAQIVPRRSRDGRFLFVGVDIGAGDLADGHQCDGE